MIINPVLEFASFNLGQLVFEIGYHFSLQRLQLCFLDIDVRRLEVGVVLPGTLYQLPVY